MNLTPGYTYRLLIDSPKVQRQLPQELEVTIPLNEDNADVFGVKLYVFEKPTTITVEGSIIFEDQHLNQLNDVKIDLCASTDLT
jgi:uridine kinase